MKQFPVYEFRPDKIIELNEPCGPILRYNDGKWTPDDGSFDLAFITPQCNIAIYFRLPYHDNHAWSWCKDGDWGATVRKHKNGNAWHYMSRNGKNTIGKVWNRDAHLNTIVARLAITEQSKYSRCTSGRCAEFNVLDPTIHAGLLRIRETKETVVPPSIFRCIYCGDHDLMKEDGVFKQLKTR